MFWEPFKLNNGKVVVAESIKPELMKMLQEATLKKGGELTFNEVKADLDMPDPNCYAPYFGTFQAAAKKAWSEVQKILAQTKTETGEIATEKERESKMARQRGTGAKKAGRPTKYSNDQIMIAIKAHYESHGELPIWGDFKRKGLTGDEKRFNELLGDIERRGGPENMGWTYKGSSSVDVGGAQVIVARENESGDDGAIPASEKLVEVPKTADFVMSAEAADPEEIAVAEAPQGEVAAMDSGTEPESEEPEGSGAILAPDEPAEEGIVDPETDGLVSGEDSDDKETPDDGGKPKEVDSAEEPKGADDEATPEACAEAVEKLVEAPETADPAMNAEVADPEEKAAAEAPHGEVVAMDSGAEPEGEESEEGSGAILAPEEPTEEDTVGLETADSVSGKDSDGTETPDDEGKPKEVDSAEKLKKADGKTIPALEGFYGYGGVASCCLSGDNYSISPNIMSCGGKRSMELKLCTIPAMDGGSIDLSVAISGNRDPSSTTPCDNGSDLRVVMEDAMTTFHVKGMGLSKYSLNRSARNKRVSLTIATIKRSLKIVFENCSVITVRDDVVDNVSGEFTLAIEAKVGAIYMCAGCEFEAESDSTEDPS